MTSGFLRRSDRIDADRFSFPQRRAKMNKEIIVAVYGNSLLGPMLQRRDLAAGDVPTAQSPLSLAAEGTAGTGCAEEQGSSASLFGGEPDHGTTVYNRSVESRGHVVTVRVAQGDRPSVVNILDRHRPIDIDERVASSGSSTRPRRPPRDAEDYQGLLEQPPRRADAVEGKGEERLQLAEERPMLASVWSTGAPPASRGSSSNSRSSRM